MCTILKVSKPCSINQNTLFKRVKRWGHTNWGGRRTRTPTSLSLPGCTCPQAPGMFSPPVMPRREVGSTLEQQRRSPRDEVVSSPASAKVEIRVEAKNRRQERVNLQTKKKKTQKGKKEHKGKRLTKRQDLPAENRETKSKETPASDEAGKERSQI